MRRFCVLLATGIVTLGLVAGCSKAPDEAPTKGSNYDTPVRKRPRQGPPAGGGMKLE
jgi:hypothetical protein